MSAAYGGDHVLGGDLSYLTPPADEGEAGQDAYHMAWLGRPDLTDEQLNARLEKARWVGMHCPAGEKAPEPFTPATTPNLIRKVRRDLGLSQRAFARAAGLSRKQVEHMEAGEMRLPAELAVRLIEAGYGAPVRGAVANDKRKHDKKKRRKSSR